MFRRNTRLHTVRTHSQRCAHTRRGVHTLAEVRTHSQRCAHTRRGAHTLAEVRTHSQRCAHTRRGAHTLAEVRTHSQRCAHTRRGAHTLAEVRTHSQRCAHTSRGAHTHAPLAPVWRADGSETLQQDLWHPRQTTEGETRRKELCQPCHSGSLSPAVCRREGGKCISVKCFTFQEEQAPPITEYSPQHPPLTGPALGARTRWKRDR